MKITNEIVIHKVKEIGFDLVGFTKAEQLGKETARLRKWIEQGYHASMDYMNRNFEKRLDVRELLSDAKSVISLAMNYYTPDQHEKKEGFGKISRYAWGKDYHLEVWAKLEELEEKLKEIDPDFNSRSYIDTGPVMDKEWAILSGIGWMGKNSNVINKGIGSWFFIANIITNYEFEYNKPIADFCGSCTACLEACPTGAIVQPYVVDSNKCISFLTIENKKNIDSSFKDKFDGWLFGCDVCQDVCPWNKRFSITTANTEFFPMNKELNLKEILEMEEDSFKEKFEISPIKRAKLNGLRRNAAFLL